MLLSVVHTTGSSHSVAAWQEWSNPLPHAVSGLRICPLQYAGLSVFALVQRVGEQDVQTLVLSCPDERWPSLTAFSNPAILLHHSFKIGSGNGSQCGHSGTRL